jgi:hypothetical protein
MISFVGEMILVTAKQHILVDFTSNFKVLKLFFQSLPLRESKLMFTLASISVKGARKLTGENIKVVLDDFQL